MFHIALFRPEIPPNTGNVIRLAANTGCTLHLIRPFGFDLHDRTLRRAGLDYDTLARLQVHAGYEAFLEAVGEARIFAVETGGPESYSDARYAPGDVLLFGPERRGLPARVLEGIARERHVAIPMQANNRSLNLSNAVALVVYEAWRQNGFAGATGTALPA
jgi:tRNA (cytidine/uridine-2'-O-)-methyltransferase